MILKTLSLELYIPAFIEQVMKMYLWVSLIDIFGKEFPYIIFHSYYVLQEICELEVFSNLTEDDLLEMGIESRSARSSIMAAITDLTQQK